MSRYRVYFNEVYRGTEHVDHDGAMHYVEAEDLFTAMDIAYKTARELGCYAYRLMEGGRAEYKLTAAFARWMF
jgi:hypothetical protein